VVRTGTKILIIMNIFALIDISMISLIFYFIFASKAGEEIDIQKMLYNLGWIIVTIWAIAILISILLTRKGSLAYSWLERLHEEEFRTLVIANIHGSIVLAMFVLLFYFVFTEIVGHQMSKEKLITLISLFVAIILVGSIPKVYFFIKKKPRIEAGDYKIEEVKVKK